MRGTYAGLAHPVMIDHLTTLGITAVELMPVHHFLPDHNLAERGLSNYWGYNTIAFLAPRNGYAAAGTTGPRAHEVVTQFKTMVRELHASKIEVILDVVYNHTGEGNHLGPTLSMRGVDNPAYYRLIADDLARASRMPTGRNGPSCWTPRPGRHRGPAMPPHPGMPRSPSLVVLERAT